MSVNSSKTSSNIILKPVSLNAILWFYVAILVQTEICAKKKKKEKDTYFNATNFYGKSRGT